MSTTSAPSSSPWSSPATWPSPTVVSATGTTARPAPVERRLHHRHAAAGRHPQRFHAWALLLHRRLLHPAGLRSARGPGRSWSTGCSAWPSRWPSMSWSSIPLSGTSRDVHQGSFQRLVRELTSVSSVRRSKASPIGPVWFLLMLLIFSAGLRGLAARWPPRWAGRRAAACRPPGNGAAALFAMGLGILTFAVRIWAPMGDTCYEPWHQELAHYPQYVCLFVVGDAGLSRGLASRPTRRPAPASGSG